MDGAPTRATNDEPAVRLASAVQAGGMGGSDRRHQWGVVRDFDGELGLETLEGLRLPAHVRSRGGGAHVHVAHPGTPIPKVEWKKIDGWPYPGMDVRGDKALAIVELPGYSWLTPVEEHLAFGALDPTLQEDLKTFRSR